MGLYGCDTLFIVLPVYIESCICVNNSSCSQNVTSPCSSHDTRFYPSISKCIYYIIRNTAYLEFLLKKSEIWYLLINLVCISR